MPKRIISTTCKVGFYFECPVKWNGLSSIDDSEDKWCKTCKRRVYRTDSPKEVAKLSQEGKCVAVLYKNQYVVGIAQQPDPKAMDQWLVGEEEQLNEDHQDD